MSRFFALLLLPALFTVQAFALTLRDDVFTLTPNGIANSPVISSVGLLTRIANSDLTSGVLIGDRFVLTAAHVASGAPNNAFTFTIGGNTYQSLHITTHPLFNGATGGYDVSVIELTTAVTGVTPALLYAGTAEVGVAATLGGFGFGGSGSTGANGAAPRGILRGGTNVIDATTYFDVVTGNYNSGRQLFFDFDNPSGGLNHLGSTVATSHETMLALGDSGGGLFANIGGQDYLVGTFSFYLDSIGESVQANYDDVGVATRVSSNYSFIQGVVPEPSTCVFLVAGAFIISSRRRTRTTSAQR